MGTHVKYLTMEFSNFEDLVNNGVKEGSLSAVVLSVTPEPPRSTLGDNLVEPRGMVTEDRDLDCMTSEGDPGVVPAPDIGPKAESGPSDSAITATNVILGVVLGLLWVIDMIYGEDIRDEISKSRKKVSIFCRNRLCNPFLCGILSRTKVSICSSRLSGRLCTKTPKKDSKDTYKDNEFECDKCVKGFACFFVLELALFLFIR